MTGYTYTMYDIKNLIEMGYTYVKPKEFFDKMALANREGCYKLVARDLSLGSGKRGVIDFKRTEEPLENGERLVKGLPVEEEDER